MVIHVVSAGETLSAVGRRYGVDPGLIARVNGLRPPYPLVVGQSLLILSPRRLHTVRAGETLLSIARDAGTTALQLLRNNPNLEGRAALFPGQTLVLEWNVSPVRPVELNGYAYTYADPAVLRGILPYATYLTPFTYGVAANGGLVIPDDQWLIDLAGQYAVVPLLHLSTLTEAGTFSNERASLVLSDPARQQRLAELAAAQAARRGYGGIDVDFEFIYPEQAALYAQFVGLLRDAANRIGMELVVALAPKSSADQKGVLYEGHDYAALAANADAVLLMTYEWGYTYGPPMAVAPIQSVRRVLDYAITEIPPEKIFMGFPNYAYDWTLPFVPGQSRARAIGNTDAVDLALRYGAEIGFDETAQTPYFYYTAEDGSVHEVWFEDVRSSRAKFDLVVEYGFRGLGYWNFMRPFPANFSLLNAMFSITGGDAV